MCFHLPWIIIIFLSHWSGYRIYHNVCKHDVTSPLWNKIVSFEDTSLDKRFTTEFTSMCFHLPWISIIFLSHWSGYRIYHNVCKHDVTSPLWIKLCLFEDTSLDKRLTTEFTSMCFHLPWISIIFLSHWSRYRIYRNLCKHYVTSPLWIKSCLLKISALREDLPQNLQICIFIHIR